MSPVAEEQERFFHSVDLRRRQLKLTWKDVCKQSGIIDEAVVTRLGRGGDVRAQAVFALSAWLKNTKRLVDQSGLFETHNPLVSV